ncbi:cytochrome-c peroxidase [Aeoliella sp.]|uniref:cytochrome-c peroxidase n=1 Tax=Aeoliella sp. TaxID=2795800 RepID=UPI003CCBAA34
MTYRSRTIRSCAAVGAAAILVSVCAIQQPAGSNATAATPETAADVEIDDEEQMLIEMRLRALAAESEEGEESFGFDALPMSIEELDALSTLPGNLVALPATPPYPEDNLPTPERIELGWKLYFDKRLSGDTSMSCATCHDPSKGWGDGLKRAIGFGHKELGRHSPTVINTAYNTVQFWDGRAATLEQQALGPILADGEMNMASPEAAMEVIMQAPEYAGAFEKAYGSKPNWDDVGRAIAAFERTVITGPSKFDRYVQGDKDALNESEKRGLILFTTTASCTACHSGPNFTDNKFHMIGVRQEGPLSEDIGRQAITNADEDRNSFKTPGLRNIEQSAPYMHDGSLATLEEVVEFYDKGGERDDNRSKLIQPLNLTESHKADLVAFLKALTGELPQIEAPDGEAFGP